MQSSSGSMARGRGDAENPDLAGFCLSVSSTSPEPGHKVLGTGRHSVCMCRQDSSRSRLEA